MENKLAIKTFDDIKQRFIEVCDEATFLKEASFAVQHLNKNSYLAKSTKQSILEAVLNLAQIGLTLNPVAKLAYLVPRRVGIDVICSLMPSYMGLVKLATDTGSVKTIYAYLVYTGDVFEYSLGLNPDIIHKPAMGLKTDDMIIAVYAVAILTDGIKQVDIMETHEIDAIRETSESYKSFKRDASKSCMWNDYYGEMARKTVIKRILKYLPKTDLFDKLYTAIEIDNEEYRATDGQLNYIDELLHNTTIPQERQDKIERELACGVTPQRAGEIIEDLKENQKKTLKQEYLEIPDDGRA